MWRSSTTIARPELEPRDRLLEPRDLLLLGHVELLLTLERDLLRDRERRVVAVPDRDPPVVELGDLIDGVVQQVAVVGDRDHAPGEPGDQLLELDPAIRVQMRLGLVQQEQVRLRDEARGQRHELALSAGQLVRGQREILLGDVQREQLAADLAGEPRTADLHPPIEQPLLAGEHALHPREVADHVGPSQLLLHRAELRVELRHVGTRGQDRRLGGPLVAVGVLIQVRGRQALAPHDLARGRLLEVGQDPEQRGLPGAVRPDDADPRAVPRPRSRGP
jgi:hypothetical protein